MDLDALEKKLNGISNELEDAYDASKSVRPKAKIHNNTRYCFTVLGEV